MAIWLKIDTEVAVMTNPTDSDSNIPDFSELGVHRSHEERARRAVGMVVAWYNDQILAQRQAPMPDEERTAELKAARQEAIEDQKRLTESEPAELERLAAVYAARFEELTNP